MPEWDRRVAKLASGGFTTVVATIAAKGEMEMSSNDSVGLRHGDGVADTVEGVVTAVATAGGDDEVVFAAGD